MTDGVGADHRPVRRRGRARTGSPEAGGVRALERGLSILETLAQERELSLTEIAARVDLPASTTYRLLETLRRRRFVNQSAETGLYRLGIAAFEVGSAFLPRARLHDLALPAMEALVREVNETVNLAVPDGTEAVYIAQVEGRQLVRMFTQIGARTPLYCTGVGKAMLAAMPAEEAEQLIARSELRRYTPNTITDRRELLEALARVRERGFALDDEERELGVRCIAAAILDRSGRVAGALSLSAPSSRLPADRVGGLAAKVVAATRQVSGWLGSPIG